MYFFYFDETKFEGQINPCFFIGGLIFPDKDLQAHETTLSQIQQNFFGTSILTQQTEMHGKEIFHGKADFKGRKLADRLKLLADIATFIIAAKPVSAPSRTKVARVTRCGPMPASRAASASEPTA